MVLIMTTDKHTERTGGVGRDIHEFIDQFYDLFGNKHRVIFHHKEGIEWLCKVFGESNRWIIEKHISDDVNGDMFDNPIPDKEYAIRLWGI